MSTEDTIAEFVERLGVVAQADGLPRIAGKIMAYLIVFGGPVSFPQLAEKLQVSRASVSNNTRLLEQLGVIERVSVSGKRQDHFRIRPEPYHELLRTSIARTRNALEIVDAAQEGVPSEWSGAQLRLGQLNRFYQHMLEQHELTLGRMLNDVTGVAQK
jgi:DNA-binding transcriptional regulator GbsR (MarR family)